MTDCPFIEGLENCDDCIDGCTDPSECLESRFAQIAEDARDAYD